MAKLPKRRESHYKLKVIGKSGLFHMDNEIDVEYLQTTLSIQQINEIEPVRRVFKRGTLPFDMMMQRELDDERIVNDLIPYLLDNELAFFPPITVVILDIDKTLDTPIKELYPSLKLNNNFDDGSGTIYQKREYGNLFNIDILKDDEELQRWFTELTVGSNATLLAIDGQHRLVALQTILNKLPDDEENIYNNLDETLQEKIKTKDFSKLSIPITFIFVPKLYEGNQYGINLVEGFRKIFVDINRNARKVNEMRNILLDEQDLRSIFTRKLCSMIQETDASSDNISIDEIEWEKNNRENQLSNPLAITNVLFIRDIFSSWLKTEKNEKSSLKQVMGLDTYSADLDNDKNFTYDNLDIQSFSFHQKEFILNIFNKSFLESFYLLINSIPFTKERTSIINEIRDSLNKEILSAKTASEMELLNKIKDVLFDGEEKNIHLKNKAVKLAVDEKIKPLFQLQKIYGLDILRTKLFQISFFNILFGIYNDKVISEIVDFKIFSELIYGLVREKEYQILWEKIFVDNKMVIDKGLKGHRGYSASGPLIETLGSILYLFIIKILEDKKISLQISTENLDLRKEKAKKRIENSFLNKYEIDLSKVYDEEEELQKQLQEFNKEVKDFLKVFV